MWTMMTVAFDGFAHPTSSSIYFDDCPTPSFIQNLYSTNIMTNYSTNTNIIALIYITPYEYIEFNYSTNM